MARVERVMPTDAQSETVDVMLRARECAVRSGQIAYV